MMSQMDKACEHCDCSVISRNEKQLKAQSGRTPTADSLDIWLLMPFLTWIPAPKRKSGKVYLLAF